MGAWQGRDRGQTDVFWEGSLEEVTPVLNIKDK